MIGDAILAVIGVTALAAIAAGWLLFRQGRKKPSTSGGYVALGSSFAAGIGLGPRAPGSPFICMRSTCGYPSLLARKLELSLVDMTCSGSTTGQILKGGQVFLGPQLDAVGAAARLVTITSGGNDVSYISDMMSVSGSGGPLGRFFIGTVKSIEDREFGKVTDNLVLIVQAIRKRAPHAKIAIVGYPTVMPASDACDDLGLTAEQTAVSREVGVRLSQATRRAAERTGALFVDIGALSAGHDACACEPWINGARPKSGTPFHPNKAGAHAVADAIARAIAE